MLPVVCELNMGGWRLVYELKILNQDHVVITYHVLLIYGTPLKIAKIFTMQSKDDDDVEEVHFNADLL